MVNNNPHIVFMGTPEFAVPSMLAIHHKYGIKAVVTLPDKPAGRGQNLRPTAVKVAAVTIEDCQAIPPAPGCNPALATFVEGIIL